MGLPEAGRGKLRTGPAAPRSRGAGAAHRRKPLNPGFRRRTRAQKPPNPPLSFGCCSVRRRCPEVCPHVDVVPIRCRLPPPSPRSRFLERIPGRCPSAAISRSFARPLPSAISGGGGAGGGERGRRPRGPRRRDRHPRRTHPCRHAPHAPAHCRVRRAARLGAGRPPHVRPLAGVPHRHRSRGRPGEGARRPGAGRSAHDQRQHGHGASCRSRRCGRSRAWRRRRMKPNSWSSPKGATTAQLERGIRSWRRGSRQDEAARERERHEARTFAVFPDDDGMYVVKGRLEPEVAAVLMKAIDAASHALWRQELRRPAARMARGGDPPGRRPAQGRRHRAAGRTRAGGRVRGPYRRGRRGRRGGGRRPHLRHARRALPGRPARGRGDADRRRTALSRATRRRRCPARAPLPPGRRHTRFS